MYYRNMLTVEPCAGLLSIVIDILLYGGTLENHFFIKNIENLAKIIYMCFFLLFLIAEKYLWWVKKNENFML